MADTSINSAHPWLRDRSASRAADIVLGIILLIAAAITIWDARELPFVHWYEFNSKFYPSVIAALLVLMTALLFARGFLFPRLLSPTWTVRSIVLIMLCVAALMLISWQLGWQLLLRFGPPEFAALNICILALAIALSRRSRLRAAGMGLLGLLLATVGMDAVTGQLRMTLDLEELLDGFDLLVVAPGIIVIADSIVCLISPRRFLESYGWLVRRWRAPGIGPALALMLRIIAGITLLGACWFAYGVNNREWDVAVALFFGLFGIAGKIFGWNRLVLLIGFLYSPLLEQSLRQSMLISNGNLEIFFRWPISASVWMLTCAALLLAVVLSTKRTLASRTQ
jgi:TctA family transporter